MSYDDVRAVAERMDPPPQVIALDPHTVGEVLGDVRTLAQAADAKDAGVELVASPRAGSTACGWPSGPPSPCASPRWSGSTRSSAPATGRRR